MTRDDVIRFLAGLTDKEFAELFYDATKNRDTSDVPSMPSHFVLADAQFDPDERSWLVDFIALPEPREEWVADAPICQSGKCQVCGSVMRSWQKQLSCPICGSPGYGT